MGTGAIAATAVVLCVLGLGSIRVAGQGRGDRTSDDSDHTLCTADFALGPSDTVRGREDKDTKQDLSTHSYL